MGIFTPSFESKKRKLLRLMKKNNWRTYRGQVVEDFWAIMRPEGFPFDVADYLCYRSFPIPRTIAIRFMSYNLNIGIMSAHKEGGDQYRKRDILYVIITADRTYIDTPLGDSALVMTIDDALEAYECRINSSLVFDEMINNAIAYQRS